MAWLEEQGGLIPLCTLTCIGHVYVDEMYVDNISTVSTTCLVNISVRITDARHAAKTHVTWALTGLSQRVKRVQRRMMCPMHTTDVLLPLLHHVRVSLYRADVA